MSIGATGPVGRDLAGALRVFRVVRIVRMVGAKISR